MIDKIFNEDCEATMQRMIDNNVKVDMVLTSPPYNTARTKGDAYSVRYVPDEAISVKKNGGTETTYYDCNINDAKTPDEYSQWICNLFNIFDKILKKDSVVLWQVSYGTEERGKEDEDTSQTMWLTIADIIRNTPFKVADKIVWKKNSALPNASSKNRLTRICEDVFVFCRKSENLTFRANKKAGASSKTGQVYYKPVFNFITAENNDGICKYNRATYSSELCNKLFEMYVPSKDFVVYDPFMGSGTTAYACVKNKIHYIGSEISKLQCDYAEERINNINPNESLDLDAF